MGTKMKKKEKVITFLSGILITIVIEIIIFFMSLFHWDYSKGKDLYFGKGIFKMFKFGSLPKGFEIEFGMGFLMYAFLGGIIILALSIIFRKFIKVENM